MVDIDGAMDVQMDEENDALPRLLVPINVQALASVQSFMGSVSNWSIVPMNYSQLENFESPEPQNLFNGQNLTIAGGQPWTGIILHWALPDALTQGTQSAAAGSPPADGGEIVFPPVPNRWLVLRTSMDPNNPNNPERRITRVWALQSDYVDLPGFASNSFNYDFTDNGQEYYIGRSWLLSNAPPAGSSPASAELQAIGPGDATFAAYMANINDVFSFRDDLMLDFPQNNLSVPAAWTSQNPPASGPGLPLTYMVAGWYADPAQDPLYNWQARGADGWQLVLDQLMWSVEDAPAYPSQILCHGSVYGVNWLGRAGQVQSGIPVQRTLPLVAVGNTSVEALAALVEQQINEQQAGDASPVETGAQVADILEAFQYSLLSLYDQPGGEAQVKQQKYQAGFGSGQGGTLWDIIRPLPTETSPPAPPSPPDTQPPSLTEQQSVWLAQLNSLQQDYDALSRQLDSMQLELFSDWWKKIYTLLLGSPYYNKVKAAYLKLKAQVLAQQKTLYNIRYGASGVAGLETVRQQLSASLGDALQLVSREAPRFWHPVDPVVLICGAKGSFKHGADDLYTDDGTLFCRVTGQTTGAMTVTGGNSSANVTGADLISAAQRANPFPANTATLALMGPPPMADINALFAETLLLDTTNALMMAQAALPRFKPPDNSIPPATLAAAIVALQNSIWNFTLHDALNRQAPADHPDFDGMIPSKNCMEFWSPPWSPLYLDWQVQWLPSWSKMAAALDGWQFDSPFGASDRQLDYQWTNTTPPNPNTDAFIQFQGRTLLTPKAADAFAARLEQFLEHVDPGMSGYPTPDNSYDSPPFIYQDSPPADTGPALGEVINTIDNWDLLSQSLSGFHQQLIMRDPGQHVPLTTSSLNELLNSDNQPLEPGETVAGLLDLFGEADKSLPLPQVPTSGPPRYNPIRAGHFVIKKLWVVDDMGQVLSVFTDSESNPYLQPVISQALRTPAPGQTPPFLSGIVQLAPRFIQPSRLNFRFVSAEDESSETTSDPLTNPVCGWVLPNHLDKGLTIYDAGGNALGELVLTGGLSNRRLRWEPIPNSPAPVGTPPDIANQHLRGFVEGLLAQADGGQSFLDLLSVIDQTLWTIDPLGGRADQSLSVLIGRPLALVRASLKLELRGNPVYDQGWATTGQQVQTVPYPAKAGQPNFTDLPLTVHLGNLELRDDGLLGYFTNDNYRQFNSLRLPASSSPSAYFTQRDITLTPDLDGISPASESVSLVTMLMDPRGSVHASTGILPIKHIALPGEYVEPALARMDVTFRTGPVLTDTEALRMPLPSFSHGNWSWIQHTGVTVWQEDAHITKADPKPRLTDIPLSLREGWLKLSKPMADDE
jgi:hypothetical protein